MIAKHIEVWLQYLAYCILYSVQTTYNTVYSVHVSMAVQFSVWSHVVSAHVLCSVFRAVWYCSVQCALYTVQCSIYTVHQCALYSASVHCWVCISVIAVSSHCNAEWSAACAVVDWLHCSFLHFAFLSFLSFLFNYFVDSNWLYFIFFMKEQISWDFFRINIFISFAAYLEVPPFFAISETKKVRVKVPTKMTETFFTCSYSVRTWNKVVFRQSLGLRA